MADRTVKQKLGFFHNSGARVGDHCNRILISLALLSFIASWLGAFPAQVVEDWYARGLFPKLSLYIGVVADALPISWLDPTVFLALALVVLAIRGRRLKLLTSAVAAAYLVFFWSWGINYHRMPLFSKLPFDANRAVGENIDRFSRRAAMEINRLYPIKEGKPFNELEMRGEAARRVRRVVAIIDGTSWDASDRVKTSFVVNPWFRVAGVDGLFNPLVHEPIINSRLLPIEKPFVIAHELGHVRGYPNEGDANMIALLATIMSDDALLQYSGWLHLWMYLRNTAEIDALLDEGPQKDLALIYARAREDRVRWISNFQTAILDWYLKANSVEQGVRSYSQIVVLAAGTEEGWDRYR